MRTVHLLIKPASGLCDLRCRYCFCHDIAEKREQSSYGMMDEPALEAVIRQALAAVTGVCHVAFQGRKPALAGLDFFKKAVELQACHNVNYVPVHFSIQTNGMRLNREWADFFRDNHFLVGISLDGVKSTHDCNRIDPRGKALITG